MLAPRAYAMPVLRNRISLVIRCLPMSRLVLILFVGLLIRSTISYQLAAINSCQGIMLAKNRLLVRKVSMQLMKPK